MLCRIYRRAISGALDSDAPLPGTLKRHLLRCAECREFAADAADMGRRLAQDAGDMIASGDRALAEGIKARLREPVSTSVSGRAVDRNPGETMESGPRISTFRFRPILASAGALVVVAGVLFLARQRPQPGPASDLAATFKIEEPGKYLVAAMERVNSPYETEMQLWKQTLDGAAKKLESAFDIGLGE